MFCVVDYFVDAVMVCGVWVGVWFRGFRVVEFDGYVYSVCKVGFADLWYFDSFVCL